AVRDEPEQDVRPAGRPERPGRPAQPAQAAGVGDPSGDRGPGRGGVPEPGRGPGPAVGGAGADGGRRAAGADRPLGGGRGGGGAVVRVTNSARAMADRARADRTRNWDRWLKLVETRKAEAGTGGETNPFNRPPPKP